MATPIIMPKFGQMTEESAIVEWCKKEGDTVAKGDILFTVETDKSVMEVESFEAGTLLKILVKPGVSVPVQTTVGFLGQPGEPVPEVAPPPAPPPVAGSQSPAKAAEVQPPAQRAPSAGAPVPGPTQGSRPEVQVTKLAAPPPAPAAPTRLRISPRAAALARNSVIDPGQIQGTGPGGRIVERDVRAYLQTGCGFRPPPNNWRPRTNWTSSPSAVRATADASRWGMWSAPWQSGQSR